MSPTRRYTPRDLATWALVLAAVVVVVAGHDWFGEWSTWTVGSRHVDAHDVLILLVAVPAVASLISQQRHRSALRQADAMVGVQRDLALANLQYRSLFDYHPSGVFSLDLEGRYASANPAAGEISGHAAEELVQMSFVDVVHPDDLDLAFEAYAGALAGEPQQLEVRVLHRDGHVVHVELVGLPIITDPASGEVTGVYAIGQDISERKRLDRELEEALHEARAANDAKSRFLANVSHEVRTPLASLLAATELLEDAGLTPAQGRMVATIDRSGKRLLRLVEEILDFARIESGCPDVREEPYRLREVVADVLPLAEAAARRKGIRVTQRIDPAVPEWLTGDPHRMAQVLTNLLDNAVKFTEEGYVDLRARLDPEVSAVVIEVADTGIGIAADDLERIFEAFSQADDSIIRRFGGTGLGLAITKQLVTAMGGTIEVESEVGRGTCFRLALPTGEVDPDQLPSA